MANKLYKKLLKYGITDNAVSRRQCKVCKQKELGDRPIQHKQHCPIHEKYQLKDDHSLIEDIINTGLRSVERNAIQCKYCMQAKQIMPALEHSIFEKVQLISHKQNCIIRDII